jgi:hypothetical protein
MNASMVARAAVIGVLGAFAAVAAGCGGSVAVERPSGEGGGGNGGGDGGGNGSGDGGGQIGDTGGSCWKDFGPEAPGECTIGEERSCSADGNTGWGDYCLEKCVNIDGMAVWGLKTTDFQCPFYESAWHLSGSIECTCNTPLVLSFDDGPVTFTAEAGAAFDLTRAGVCHASDWPTARTPWLAIDLDGNGSIDDGSELFGSATKLSSGGFASNGFEALRELDADHNGAFDARDPAFAKVVVWTDRNLDRQSSPGELTSLEAAGVMSIDLRDHREVRCDARGNCEGERSGFAFVDAAGRALQGTVIDVYLPMR